MLTGLRRFFFAVFFCVPTLSMPTLTAADTFVLVHGSFVGAWYWDPVVAGLEARGHRVIAVELDGGGARSTTDPATITLDDHIDDVATAIAGAAEPVILVAHSYGGRPATGAWDRQRAQIKAVVLIEAIAPYGTGDIAIPEEITQRMILAETDPLVLQSGIIPAPDYLSERYPGRVITGQSIRALHAPVVLQNRPLPDTPGAYVLADRSDAPIFKQYAEKIALQRHWTVYEIESGHDVVQDAADVIVRLLDKVATEVDQASGN